MKKIYLDNSTTTPVDKKVLFVMTKYWSDEFGNPSSIHSMGVIAKIALQKARKTIADIIGGHDREIIFTSGGTEANNLAIFGVKNFLEARPQMHEEALPLKKMHFITTEIEHSSILECFKKLEKDGHEISYMKVDENGLVNPKDLRKIIKPETILVSIGYANNEIGVIQPIKEIIKEIRHYRKEFGRNPSQIKSQFDGVRKNGFPYLHIDASQTAQYLNMNVEELGVDLMTLDAQKMYGPKGIGALFVRDGIKIEPIIFGGGQENGRRSGTENIPLVVGFAKAFELAQKSKEKESKRLTEIRNEFFNRVKKFVPSVIINGHLEARTPNNINISILGQDGEMLVLRLNEAGIICSSSSACSSGDGESMIVRRLAEKTQVSKEEIDLRAKSALRFSMGNNTKIGDIKKLLKILKKLQ